MTTPNSQQPLSNRLPSLVGALTQDYEEPIGGGGSVPTEFATPSEVRAVFAQGISSLTRRITMMTQRHRSGVTVARFQMRPRAIAKSHRHPTLFDHLQVAGIDRPGDILAVVTSRTLHELSELVEGATPRQLAQLSAVQAVSPFEPDIDKDDNGSVVTFFDGHLDDGSSLQERGMRELRQLGVELDHYGKAPHAFVSSNLPSEDDLREMPWLRKVRPLMRLRALTSFSTNPLRPRNITLNEPLPVPVVGVIDSGIDIAVPWLQRLVLAQESHIPPQFASLNHGTLVGALAATGGGFTSDITYFPQAVARLVDIQIIGSGNHEAVDEQDLITTIEDAVGRYGPKATNRPARVDQPVAIWNLSLGADGPAAEDSFSLIATELDRIAQEQGVIFTIAAGNYQDPPLRSWVSGNGPEMIADGADRVSAPGDAALGVTVGSLSDSSNPPSAAPADCPSPFSRRGPGPGMLVKPDVVHYGGTCGRLLEAPAGIRGPGRNGVALEEIGTSFAAPRVAAQLAELFGVLPDPEPEMLKLLLLLSCQSPGDHKIDRRESVNYYGFGVPDSPIALLSCNPWESIVLLKGELRPGRTLQTMFPFPTGLEIGGRRRGHVRIALVYTPKLDADKGAEYCQTNVTVSFGRQFDYPERDPRRYKREVPPLPHEEGTGPQVEKDLIEHGWKWSPSKLYERTFRQMQVHPRELGWRLTAELLLRRELEPERDYVRQPFWLGIRIDDPERTHGVYAEIRQQIEVMGLAQAIRVRPPLGAI